MKTEKVFNEMDAKLYFKANLVDNFKIPSIHV